MLRPVAPVLLSIDQAAALMGITRRHVFRLLKDGRLSRYRGAVGDRQVYVAKQEVRRLMVPERLPD